jgi:antitoxin (DNA-binding transcriptional repressor) of toxin-antitoxin stability system
VITKNGKAVARIVSERDYRAGAAELDKLLLLRELSAADIYATGEGAPMGGATGTPGAVIGAGLDSVSSGGNASGADAKAHAGSAAAIGLDLDVGEWMLTHNGEPVAFLTPIPKKKKKRQLGFIKGPPVTAEEEAALFESEWTEEDEEEWLNKF